MLFALAALAACGKPATPAGPPGIAPVQAVVAQAHRQPLEEKISLIGNLAPKESVELRSEIEGRVLALEFDEGERVEAGKVLVRLDAGKLEAEVAEAEARHELARQDFERGRTLLERGTISVQQFDQFRATLDATRATLRLAQERLADAVVRAPFAGQVGERLVSPGQYVSRGELLSTLTQTDPLEVELHVPERYLGQVAAGQRIDVGTAAYPGERFAGTVYFLAPRLDERSRTLLVKAYIDNADGRLKPGMFASLELIFRARENVVVVPEAALSYRGDEVTVVVLDAEGRAEPRLVEVGVRLAGLAEIVSGVAAGEHVVVEGAQKLAPGTPVSIAPESRRYGVLRAGAERDAG